MKPTTQKAITIILAAATGVGLTLLTYDHDDRRERERSFQRGRAQGFEECKGPSKLEKAAKWLAE